MKAAHVPLANKVGVTLTARQIVWDLWSCFGSELYFLPCLIINNKNMVNYGELSPLTTYPKIGEIRDTPRNGDIWGIQQAHTLDA